jgi:mono/diheme cytochrome c family protein
MKHKIALTLSIAGILFLSGCSFTLAQDVTPPPGYTPAATIPTAETASDYPLLPPNPVEGRQTYESDCANCHGVNGLGNGSQSGTLSASPKILKDDGSAFNYSLVKWFDAITTHATSSTMPAFSSVMDDRTRWNISAYLYMMNVPAGYLESGKQIYTGTCQQCHGEKGKGDGSSASGLTIQPPDFTFERILTSRSDADLFNTVTNGSSNAMPAFGDTYSDEERRAVVAYVRSLSFSGVVVKDATKIPTTSVTPTAQTVQPVGTEVATVPASTTSANHVKVYGSLINDSGTSIPKGLQVTLKIFDNMQENGSLDTIVLPDGTYVFPNVPMSSDRIVIATVSYGGQEFNSEPSKLPTTDPEQEQTGADLKLDIHISDSTTNTSALTVDRLHVFFDFSREGVVQVIELFLVSNKGNQTVVPESKDKGTLSFELPANASNLQFQDSVIGERYLLTDKGFTDTASVPPGDDSLQVLFAYDLPYAGKADFALPIPYNTGSIIVMAPSDGVKLKSDMLVDGGMKTNTQSSFRVYNATNIQAGSTLKFSMAGQPSTQNGKVSGLKFNTTLIGVFVLLLAVGMSGFYLYERSKARVKKQAAAGMTEFKDRDTLMDAIIALDEQYKSGKINQSAYQQRRDELKDQLKNLL